MSAAPTTVTRPKVRHLAVVTGNPAEIAKFYVDVLGMELIPGRPGDNERYATDGYIMLALLYQRLWRGESHRGMNHFGFQVASRDEASKQIVAAGGRQPQPRPATIPFAEYRGNDPDGNGFDLSERGFLVSKVMTDERAARYAAQEVVETTRPTLRHIGMYVQDPERTAQFYVDALGMERLPHSEGDTARYVTDGYMTLDLQLYRLEGHASVGLNYYGFTVKSIEDVVKRITAYGCAEPMKRTTPLPYDVYRAVDPEGNWFNLIEYGVVNQQHDRQLAHSHA
jgi:catechol 2,3-dioxygenase-like lactoylglutathione lyase family enzyme